jgi:hypothetical protein
LVTARVLDDAWYPMLAFERLGNAILKHVAMGNLEAVRLWGRFSVDKLRAAQPELLAPGDPIETLNRFGVLRATYFDFDALTITELSHGHARIEIRYHMGAVAEEAASLQTMGFFERLLEIAGALDVYAVLREKSWAGDPRTQLALEWGAAAKPKRDRPPSTERAIGRIRGR